MAEKGAEGAYDVAGVTVASKNDEQSAAPSREGKALARTAEGCQYNMLSIRCTAQLTAKAVVCIALRGGGGGR